MRSTIGWPPSSATPVSNDTRVLVDGFWKISATVRRDSASLESGAAFSSSARCSSAVSSVSLNSAPVRKWRGKSAECTLESMPPARAHVEPQARTRGPVGRPRSVRGVRRRAGSVGLGRGAAAGGTAVVAADARAPARGRVAPRADIAQLGALRRDGQSRRAGPTRSARTAAAPTPCSFGAPGSSIRARCALRWYPSADGFTRCGWRYRACGRERCVVGERPSDREPPRRGGPERGPSRCRRDARLGGRRAGAARRRLQPRATRRYQGSSWLAARASTTCSSTASRRPRHRSCSTAGVLSDHAPVVATVRPTEPRDPARARRSPAGPSSSSRSRTAAPGRTRSRAGSPGRRRRRRSARPGRAPCRCRTRRRRR